MNKTEKIFVAGHRGMVGAAIVRRLKEKGFNNLVFKSREQLNLLDQSSVKDFFAAENPVYVIDSAAKVGGIKANMTYPAEFLYENLQIQNNLIWSAKEAGVKNFLFLGSSCIYPRDCPQPMKEDYFLDGRPEPTNEAYAIAKIAGMKLCEYVSTEHGLNYTSCMPTNIYGEHDNFDPATSHVLPALMRRMHEAALKNTPEVVIWGTGVSRREFMHVDDLADAVVWLMEHYDGKEFLNIGTGEDISIKEVAYVIKDLVGYKGRLVFDASKPDGMPKKLLDVSRLHGAGWRHTIPFDQGLKRTYEWYLANIAQKADASAD